MPRPQAAPRQRRPARWRVIEALALLATIPAFYLSLLSLHGRLAAALYLAAGVLMTVVAWRDARVVVRPRRPVPAWRAAAGLGPLLAAALLVSAALPRGEAADLVTVRLGTAVLVALRLAEAALPASLVGRLPRLLALGLGVLGACGLGFWWLEPTAKTFADGLWLAFTTAATVGYGDIVPSTAASKIFAVFVVLAGFAMLSLVTASVAALWVRTEERRIEHEILRDLHRELRRVRAELAALRRDATRGAVDANESED